MLAEEHIRGGRLVAIVRVAGITERSAPELAETLVAAGVRALEFTFGAGDALGAARAARAAVGDRAAVGVGTVLEPEQVDRAADHGAQFVVSPDVSTAVIGRAAARGLLALPGAFTPTEVVRAIRAGARMVKLFPAQPPGVGYLRTLRGPLPDVPFVPTGGIGIEDVPQYLAAGAVAVALGSALVRSADELDQVRRRARRAVELAALQRR
jgi:Entner-Doudoroff aldolase